MCYQLNITYFQDLIAKPPLYNWPYRWHKLLEVLGSRWGNRYFLRATGHGWVSYWTPEQMIQQTLSHTHSFSLFLSLCVSFWHTHPLSFSPVRWNKPAHSCKACFITSPRTPTENMRAPPVLFPNSHCANFVPLFEKLRVECCGVVHCDLQNHIANRSILLL